MNSPVHNLATNVTKANILHITNLKNNIFITTWSLMKTPIGASQKTYPIRQGHCAQLPDTPVKQAIITLLK